MTEHLIGPTPSWRPGNHYSAAVARLAADIFGTPNDGPWWATDNSLPGPTWAATGDRAILFSALRLARRARRTGHKLRAHALMAAARHIGRQTEGLP